MHASLNRFTCNTIWIVMGLSEIVSEWGLSELEVETQEKKTE